MGQFPTWFKRVISQRVVIPCEDTKIELENSPTNVYGTGGIVW